MPSPGTAEHSGSAPGPPPPACVAALRLTHPGRRQRKAFLIQSTLSAAEVAIFTAYLSSEPVTRSAESLPGGSWSEESLASPSGKHQEAAVAALGAGGGPAVRCADWAQSRVHTACLRAAPSYRRPTAARSVGWTAAAIREEWTRGLWKCEAQRSSHGTDGPCGVLLEVVIKEQNIMTDMSSNGSTGLNRQ
ncbi:hypothetical protein NDU88_003052 [Pleurodeles waltl]|uniref:Uncharacterized protein n=1 Tax=Pleurodeles waltl TaxID=8319 RepID=A0AAV7W536_PLEWA|nr:hypothetical protein NDU88_003052 [Pleurodeles waltl]